MDPAKNVHCSADLPTTITHNSMSSEDSQGANADQHTKVAIRIRPLNEQEARLRSSNHARNVAFRKKSPSSAVEMDPLVWTIKSNGNTDMIMQSHVRKFESKSVYTFDKIFGEDKTTSQVYETLVRPIVKESFRGRHGTVFCYGQTGSGKTYTMQGNDQNVEEATGIVQMAGVDLFQWIQGSSRDFSVRVSFIELYNERVRDLLGNCNELPVREDPKMGVWVDAKEAVVENSVALLELLHLGNKNRATAATQLNERSSRSHSMFRIKIESREKAEAEGMCAQVVRVSNLNLVDLAGSENGKNGKLTKTSSSLQRESGNINQSLLSLSQVIQALSLPPKKRPAFINFRDSKLTRLLQPQLSGNALMAILCCVSPSELFIEETRSTLRFASRAKLVQTEATVNEVIDDTAMIRKLQGELIETRNVLGAMKEREISAENDLVEARDELKKIKEMIFGEGELPKFENATQYVTHTNHTKKTGEDSSQASTTFRRDESRFRHDSQIDHVKANMSLAKGTYHNCSPILHRFDEQSTSTFKLDTGKFRRVTLGKRSEHPNHLAAVGISHGPPSEVVIMMESPSTKDIEEFNSRTQINEELNRRTVFLHSRLENAEDLIESLVHDVESARLCIRQLVFKNVNLVGRVQKLQRKLAATEVAKDNQHRSQYMLLKFCIYLSLFFFLFGCQELFLACGLFLWLTLEVVT